VGDPLRAQREKLGDRLRQDLVCDTCGVPATHLHLLPWCVDTQEVALSGVCNCRTGDEREDDEEIEARHLDSGYHFPMIEWAWDFSDSPKHWSMRDQLRTKHTGEKAIQMVDARLASQ